MSAGGPLGRNPLWQEEFSVDAGRERYVTRRQFIRFLTLTSFGMFVGNLAILARSLRRRDGAHPEMVVAADGEIPVGGVKVFHYPDPKDACLLIRTGPERYVAFSQKCTHLSCAVFYDPDRNRIECPCHHGFFSAETGRVLQGPPPRPLPRIRLQRRSGRIVAVGFEEATDDGA